MTTKKYNLTKITLLTALILMLGFSCTRDLDDLEPATFPANGEVFIDAFSAGLNYGVFSGASLTAFDVDTDVKYDGESSMRFAVPNNGEPNGSYAAGAFFTDSGRDLSGFDALTFWAKASGPVTIDEIGFGNDFAEGTYTVSYTGISMNSNWKKYIIPIPEPSKLTQERGLLYYVATPDDEGNGYTFWMDEVQFEKLGTLANPRGAILDGQDQGTQAETGDVVQIGGTTATFNMPTGTDQTINASPAYFTYISSDPGLASVSSTGAVTVIDSGTVVITAMLGEVEASGSLTIGATGQTLGPTEPAPVPTEHPDSVISLFSNAYDNVQVDLWNTFWQNSTAETFDVQIDGDDVKRYKNLNFVGIEFTSQTLDVTGMSHFHMDIWTPDPTDLPAAFKVLLVDFGPNNTFDGGDDSSHELSFTSPTLQTGTWVSLDMPMSDFLGLTGRSNLAQMVLSGDIPNVYVDNVYFYTDGTGGSGGSGPNVAAPTPTEAPGEVISIFSDAYTNVEGTNFYPDWGQATTVSEISVQGNNTLAYIGFNYQGIELAASQDVSGMGFLHLDVWTDNSTEFNAYLISSGPVEASYSLSVPTSGWLSVDIPLSAFSSVDLADIIQMKFDGNGNIYLDNIYFHAGTGGGDTPTDAAPTPTHAPGDVISVFSDNYSNLEGTNFYADWGQATTVSEVSIAGNNTLLYAGLNYQGIELSGSQDISGMNSLHIDIWTANSTSLSVFLISTGPVETPYSISVPTSGWASLDIPLSAFSPVDLGDVFQLKWEGDGDVYIDNIYFHTGSGSGGDTPEEAAPTPTDDPGSVISIFSDAYTNVEGTNFYPDWGQATVVSEVPVASNNTLLYTGLNYQGVELGSSQDVSGMTYLHVDIWTANATTLEVFLISTGPVETPYAITVPTSGWLSLDIPLTNFSPVDLADVFQLKFVGDGDVYIDNIYFRN
jgi:hypothetical protein